MIARDDVHEGMLVRSSEGKRMGRVTTCGEASFTFERRFIGSTDYVARYEDVAGVSHEEIRLARAKKDLEHPGRKHAVDEPVPASSRSFGDEGGGGMPP